MNRQIGALRLPHETVLSYRDSLSMINSPECLLPKAGRSLASAIIENGRVFMHKFGSGTPEVPVLDVTHFFNGRVETGLISEIGQELAMRLNATEANVLLTASSSGNIPTFATAQAMGNIPVIYAQKGSPVTQHGHKIYSVPSRSHTRDEKIQLAIAADHLPRDSRVVIVDDFLATARTMLDLMAITDMAQCPLAAVAAVIEKSFEGGRDLLRRSGLEDNKIISVIDIQDMKPGEITIKGVPFRLSLKSK